MAFGAGHWMAAVVLMVTVGAVAQSDAPVAPNSPASLPDPPDQSPVAQAEHEPSASDSTSDGAASATSRPAASATADRPLRGRSARENKTLSRPPASTGPGSWWRVLGALVLVLGAILGMRWLLRRGSATRNPAGPSRAVEVLSRTAVSPKQAVMLIRVGPRLLVVGAGTDSMNTLAEIDDPEQVSQLLGAVEQAKAHSLTNTFSKALSGWRARMGPAEDAAPADLTSTDRMFTPAGGLADRFKAMVDKMRGGPNGLRRRP